MSDSPGHVTCAADGAWALAKHAIAISPIPSKVFFIRCCFVRQACLRVAPSPPRLITLLLLIGCRWAPKQGYGCSHRPYIWMLLNLYAVFNVCRATRRHQAPWATDKHGAASFPPTLRRSKMKSAMPQPDCGRRPIVTTACHSC